MTPQAAIHRVTGEPARWFRLDAGVLKGGAKADVVLLNPLGLQQAIAPPVEILDPILDGEPRMVKRGSDQIIHSVYIKGVPVVSQGQVSDRLGCEPLGTVLFPLEGSRE